MLLYFKIGGMTRHNFFGKVIQQMIVQARQERMKTQKQLSIDSGLSRQFISLMESGRRSISFESFCLLAWGLGLGPEKLLKRFLELYERSYRGLDVEVAEMPKAEEYVKNIRSVSK